MKNEFFSFSSLKIILARQKNISEANTVSTSMGELLTIHSV